MTDNQSAMNELLLSFVSKRAVSRDVRYGTIRCKVWQPFVNEESEEVSNDDDEEKRER